MIDSDNYQPVDFIPATQFGDLRSRGLIVNFLNNVLLSDNQTTSGWSAILEVEPLLAQLACYRIGLIRVPSGCGPTYISQEEFTAFLPLTGSWRYKWQIDDHKEGEVVIEPADLIFLPTGPDRSFENIGQQEAWLLGLSEMGSLC